MKKAPRLLLAGVAVLVGVASASVGRAGNLSSAGTVTAVAGPVTVARLSATPQPLKFRNTLFWRDVVEARKDGIARMLLAGKTTVTVRELSRLELREEVMAEGIRYTAELVSGKVRASVARMLMRPGDQVEIRTKNAVASVRGTDFIVETLAVPSQARAFGLLGVRQVTQAMADAGSQSGETVVLTLSGVVDVSNRLAGTGRVESVRAYEAVRVSGRQDPLRVQLTGDDVKVLLQGLTPPRPQEARSGDRSEAVGRKVERVALATSAQSVRVFEHGGGDGGLRGPDQGDDQSGQSGSRQSGSQGSPSGGQGASQGQGWSYGSGQGAGQGSQQGNGQSTGQGDGNGLALGQSNTPGGGQSNGLALGQGNGNGLGLGQGNGVGNGQGNAPAAATPARSAVPATPAVAPATPATPAVLTAPAPAVGNPGNGNKPATPPGQAKK